MQSIPDISGLRSRADHAKALRKAAESEHTRLKKEARELTAEGEVLDLTSALLRRLMDLEVTEAKEIVEQLLTEGLQTVFSDQDLKIKAEVEEKRGKVYLNLLTVEKHADGKVTEGDASESNGGAVSTVQSVLMRIITTIQRGLRPVLFLDESLPAFDPHYVTDMMRFLSTLCSRLGFDIILVTQNQSLPEHANVAYTLRKSRGQAVITKAR